MSDVGIRSCFGNAFPQKIHRQRFHQQSGLKVNWVDV